MNQVLLLSPTAAPGGAERVFLSLARRLPEWGWRPNVILLEHGGLEDRLKDADIQYQVWPTGRMRHLHRTSRTIATLFRTALERDVDVLFSNQTKGHLYGGPAALAARVSAVWWQHGTPEPTVMERIAARVPAASIICGSYSSLRSQRDLMPDTALRMIHPGIDVEAIGTRVGEGKRVRRRLGWDEAVVVGIVGRLEPWKGQEIFLRAAHGLASTHQNVRFALIGGAIVGSEGEYPRRLHDLADHLDISDRVYFAGHKQDIYPWFDALDVVVNASYREPFGLVLIEAMALGKPVVASASGGPLEIIEDEKSGLLFPVGDHRKLANAIGRVLDNNQLRNELSAGARRRASDFTEQVMTEKFACVLNCAKDG